MLDDFIRAVTEHHVIEEVQLWERKIQLLVRPKPTWMPIEVWKWMLKTVLIQREIKS